ncbi:MAG: protein kinase [Phycisphaerales bacterium]
MSESGESNQSGSDQDLVAKALAQARAARGQGHAAKLDAASIKIPGYTILSEIHRGGQGAVYKAVQDGTRRTVAVKLMLRGAFAGDRERARFEREIRVLSQIRHPGVVSIYESGEADGRVYFVMEYVSGKPLDDYLRQAALPVRDRLDLFARVCGAVHAAHLQGVIHRDLKPDNIRIDASGEPHILDFGLAKVAGSLPENTDGQPVMMTMTGQFVGSLPWASPEQAEGVASRIDIRTDVYSLGVILYQMLTARFPYTVEGTTREVLSSIAEANPQRPRSLDRSIPAEVETIVLRALAKDRDRRYQSAGELARDIQRYLGGQPILARSDSLPYVLRKTLNRHRVAAATGGIVLLLIVGFGAGMTVLWNLASNRGDALTVALEQREADLDYVLDVIFGEGDLRQFARDRSVRDVVETLSETADDRFASDPIRLATLHEMLGRSFRAFDQPDRAEDHLRRALDLRSDLHGPDHELTLGTRNTLAEALKDQDRFQEAAEHYHQIETVLLNQKPTGAQARRRLASVMSNRARLLERMERCVEANAIMQRSIGLLATDASDETSRRLLLFARGHSAGLDAKMGQCQRAMREMRSVHEGILDAFGPTHPAAMTSAIKLAGLLIDAGRPEEVAEILEALPSREDVTRLQARALASRGDLNAATERLRELEQTPETRLLHAQILVHRNQSENASAVLDLIDENGLSDLQHFNLAVLRARVDQSSAERLRELALRAFGADAPALHYATGLDAALRTQTPAQLREAAAELESIAAGLARECGQHHRWTVETRLLWAGVLEESGDSAAARSLLDPMLDWSVSEHGPDHPMTRMIRRAIDG